VGDFSRRTSCRRFFGAIGFFLFETRRSVRRCDDFSQFRECRVFVRDYHKGGKADMPLEPEEIEFLQALNSYGHTWVDKGDFADDDMKGKFWELGDKVAFMFYGMTKRLGYNNVLSVIAMEGVKYWLDPKIQKENKELEKQQKRLEYNQRRL
jgi:hypothetical protein